MNQIKITISSYDKNGRILYNRVEGQNAELLQETKYLYDSHGKLSRKHHIDYKNQNETVHTKLKTENSDKNIKSKDVIQISQVVTDKDGRKHLDRIGFEITTVYKNRTRSVVIKDNNMKVRTSILIDKNGRMLEKRLDDEKTIIKYKYDEHGNMIEANNVSSQICDVWDYEYDENEHLIKIYKNGKACILYQYDDNGNVSFELNEETKLEKSFLYNQSGKISWIRTSDIEKSPEIVYEYTKTGDLSKITKMYKDRTTITEYCYDAENKLILSIETTYMDDIS